MFGGIRKKKTERKKGRKREKKGKENTLTRPPYKYSVRSVGK